MWPNPHLLKKSLMGNFIFCAVLSVARVVWKNEGDVNSSSGESWSTEASFNSDSNEETLTVRKIACNNNKWDIKYIQILSAPGEGATE